MESHLDIWRAGVGLSDRVAAEPDHSGPPAPLHVRRRAHLQQLGLHQGRLLFHVLHKMKLARVCLTAVRGHLTTIVTVCQGSSYPNLYNNSLSKLV